MNKKKRLLAIFLSVLFLLELVACGSKKEKAEEAKISVDATDPVLSKEYVYVPTFTDLKNPGENTWSGNEMFRGDKLYYTLNTTDPLTGDSEAELMTVDIHDVSGEEQITLPEFKVEGYAKQLSIMEIDEEDNLYMVYFLTPLYKDVMDIGPDDYKEFLVKYDKDMNLVYQSDVKEMYTKVNSTFLSSIVAGKDGKLIASANNMIYIIGVDGILEKSITTNANSINGLFTTKDGRVFFTRYSSRGAGLEVIEVDTQKYAAGDVLENLPTINGIVKAGTEGKLLMPTGKYLYEYDLATGVATPVLDWLDSYVSMDFVSDYMSLPNGDFILYYEDWRNNCREIVKLTKTKATEIPEKETIVFASLYGKDQVIEHGILRFNQINPTYKMVYKAYIDDTLEWTADTYSNAVTAMNMDLISDNPPDIIDLGKLNIPNLAAKGVLENLNPYLEKSKVINKDDFIPGIINGYTFDGALVTIPRGFFVYTLLGKKSIFGEKEGCTVEELIQLSRKYPEADLMAYSSKENVLSQFLKYNSSAFVDLKAGTCSFDSPEFINLLEYANTYNMEIDHSKDLPEQIEKNEVLLLHLNLDNIRSYQMYRIMLGEEATLIGYPTIDGSPGVYFKGEHVFGITTQSTHKEVAWTFLESLLDYDQRASDFYSGFSCRLDEMEEEFQRDMTPVYEKDENGNLIEISLHSIGMGMNWGVSLYAATQEEVDELKTLIQMAKPAFENDEEIYGIISEETGAFFHGQKSAKEVADIIQNRVSIYLSENS